MRDCVALGNVAQDLVAVQLADKSQFRRRGNMRQDERKADLLQHPVRHRIVGLRLADDAFQIKSLVEVERRQAKKTRTVTLAPQIGPPHVQMYAAEVARHDVLERRMSDGFAVDTPCEYEAAQPIDCEAHALGVGFGNPGKVSDVAVQIFGGERANSQLHILLIVTEPENHKASDQNMPVAAVGSSD